MSFSVGDRVLHTSRSELGFGIITEIYSDEICDVRFGATAFSGLSFSCFICAKKALEESMRSEIANCIAKNDFEGARQVHTKYVQDAGENSWPEFGVYLDNLKARHESKVKCLERQELVIHRLLDENFIDAQRNAAFPTDPYQVNFNEVKLTWLRRYFTDPASKSLSDEQLLAIGNTDKTVLLRARAGSGKTTVIKHKVDFKIRHLGFDPSEVMVLAFNKTAAQQVKRDVQKEFHHLTFNNARTFHSLAHKIVRPTQNLLFDVGSGSNAKQSQFVEGLLEKESNPAFKKDLYEFFRAELKQMENIGSLLNEKDYFTYRRNDVQDTLNGDPVKSLGEKWIADFLFEHDIRYVYERPWFRDKTGQQGNFYPDFSLAVNSQIPDVVIEHWGIDEYDSTQSIPLHWNKTWQEYRLEMDIKRSYWRDHNRRNPSRAVTLLETSVRNTKNGRVAFENHLKRELGNIGVKCTKLSSEVLVDRVIRKRVARFSHMCLQFIQRAKKQCISPHDLDTKIEHFSFDCDKEKVFCLIANRIFHRYARELAHANLIDFDDLMTMAVDRIVQERGNVVIDQTVDTALNLNTLKWLMVDEFQDFSKLFFNLVDALRSHNPALRVFCVGDD
ncbi:UvrD-helicase domain-containing protein [Luminiphilus sp.]|nr:UvrD-helicase domain-containing protein [Luminiphilus sp.]